MCDYSRLLSGLRTSSPGPKQRGIRVVNVNWGSEMNVTFISLISDLCDGPLGATKSSPILYAVVCPISVFVFAAAQQRVRTPHIQKEYIAVNE